MLTFKTRETPSCDIDVFGILPEELQGKSPNEISRQIVFLGNRSIELGELFIVSGDASDQQHVWEGDLRRVNGVGAEMKSGWIAIQGDVGNHVGSRMRGGTILVSGSCGHYPGAEMTGGLLHVRGDAGNSVGAALDGGQPGQNGGAIMIEGSAGNLVGKAMRRGMIAVAGNVGNCCGFAMRAGTIVVLGSARKNVGLEMTRGTIVLTQPPSQPLVGFDSGGQHQMPVTRILDRYLKELGFRGSIDESQVELFHGDRLRGGRGEVLVLC